ncbi:Non-specific serine/threonine protein kinase [Mycena indigotica]|uniref:Non-specific serine/threonine protein kinase n=1 Tax=Mycena indigotica TaxID=2126181 RepID=A0A8H6SD92_9AGAR|nr:Non-specific serine/threonine protein kinase [Mycena indigotica]KAF7297328.1 Non-specific serine/threonine protein kinase [Mycena indigotica]
MEGGKQSRFSMFKLNQKAAPMPPPLPPKDPVYLEARNRSMASLSPDSIPTSPLSGDPYGPSGSSISLALPPAAPAPRKRGGFFKFGKQKSAENSPGADDENISMPWNFSHNMHVDEAFTGLPPSWSTSLQEAGFTEDEIAAIQQRRMPVDRTRGFPPSVVKPVPRTTSLPKSQHTPASSLSASSVSASSSRSSPAPDQQQRPSPPPGSWQDTPKQRQETQRQQFDQRDYSPTPSRKQYSPQQDPPARQYSPQQQYERPNYSSPSPPSREPSLQRSVSPPSRQQTKSYSPSPSPSPPPSPEPDRRPPLNPKNLKLDLALEESADSWSDAILSATPWSASAQSPRFTVTAPPAESKLINQVETEVDSGLAYDDLSPSPSPTKAAFGSTLDISPTVRDNRDSGMSDATMLGVPASAGVVRKVSFARRAVANVVATSVVPPLASPQSSHFGSSSSSESQDHQTPTTELAEDEDEDDTLDYYSTGKHYLEENGFNFGAGKKNQGPSAEDLEEEARQREWEEMQRTHVEWKERKAPSPPPPVKAAVIQPLNPSAVPKTQIRQQADTFGAAEEEEEDDYEYGYDFPSEDELESEAVGSARPSPRKTPNSGRPVVPKLVTSKRDNVSPGPLTALSFAQTPITPAHRYAGWVAATVSPLEEFIDEPNDPRDFYVDLQEIAEGESGSVFAAVLEPTAPLAKLKLPPLIKARDADDVAHGKQVLVAMKCVALVPGGSQKLIDLQRECTLLRGLMCEQLLGLDALYVDLMDDALWIRMELMERSLADVVGLADQGLRLQEPRIIARFASDMLLAIDYLQKHQIAHRDLRSDNLLLNSEGVLKLTDFSNALLVTPQQPMSNEQVGVMYWQAPEVLSGFYDPLKVDVWSVGATIWEIAEATPPFSDTDQPEERWPPLSNPSIYPPALHDFLTSCSEPAASRPTASALLKSPFLQKACGRTVIVQLLSRCMAIEQALQEGESAPDSPS